MRYLLTFVLAIGAAGQTYCPDAKTTPGVTNPAVTQANIKRTICKAGWTKTIRPTVSYTNKLNLSQIAELGLKGKPGDYEEDSGISLIKKLIIRRLLTPKGGFFHLPDYGLGFAVKEPINPTRLVELKTDIERQCKLEPEIGSVSAVISVGSDGVTIVTIAGTTRSGQPFGPWEIAA